MLSLPVSLTCLNRNREGELTALLIPQYPPKLPLLTLSYSAQNTFGSMEVLLSAQVTHTSQEVLSFAFNFMTQI